MIRHGETYDLDQPFAIDNLALDLDLQRRILDEVGAASDSAEAGAR